MDNIKTLYNKMYKNPDYTKPITLTIKGNRIKDQSRYWFKIDSFEKLDPWAPKSPQSRLTQLDIQWSKCTDPIEKALIEQEAAYLMRQSGVV
jgi:hypothetical protein